MPGLEQFNKSSARERKVQQILSWYTRARDDRAQWLEDRAYYWNLYTGRVGRPSLPWAGASDIHWPLISKIIEAAVPRYIQSLLGSEPIAHVRPIEPGDIEESDDQEIFLNWALKAEVRQFVREMNNWVRMTLLDGTSVVKIHWENTWRRTRQKYILPLRLKPGESFAQVTNTSAEELEIEDTDYIDHLFSVKDEITRKRNGIYRCRIREGEKWVEADVEIVRPEEDEVEKTVLYVSSEKLVYSAPIVRVCNLEDLYAPFRASDLQTCQFLLHETWLSLDDLARRRDEGIYRFTDKEWKRLKAVKEAGGPQAELGGDSPRKEAIDEQEGIIRGPYFLDGKFVVLEAYAYDDIDDDSRDEHLVYAVVPEVMALARAQYLEEEFPHGRRPFADMVYIPVQDRFYGKGIAELLAGLQVEANTIVNLVNDRENLINNPFFFYEPAAGQDPDQYLRVRPGEGIPVADASKIVFPNWAKNPVGGLELLQLIEGAAEEVASKGPIQMGQRQPGSVPRTARGTMALISEGNIKDDTHIKLAQEGVRELLFQIFSLYQEFMPDEKWFRIVGESKPRKITRASLRGQWDFILSGNTANTNKEVQQNKATILYQTMAAEPLMQQDLSARRELLRTFFRAYNDGDLNIDNILPNVPVPLRPREPKEVIGLLAQGYKVEPRQGEDPERMIREIEKFVRSPEFEAVAQQYVPLFAETVEAYKLLATLMQQMSQMMSRAPGMAFQPGTTGPGNGGGPPPGPGALAPMAGMPTESMMGMSR